MLARSDHLGHSASSAWPGTVLLSGNATAFKKLEEFTRHWTTDARRTAFLTTGCGTTDFTDDTDERGEGMSNELVHKDVSESIIGAAMTVLNALKPGLDKIPDPCHP